jgi:predicted MPP superfamily phosphohydrolase
MKFWVIIFFLLPILGNVYVFWRIWQILPFVTPMKVLTLSILSLGLILLFVNFGIGLEKMPMSLATVVYEIGTSWVFILLYLFMMFLLMDIGRLVHLVPPSFMHDSIKGSITVLAVILSLFIYGNIHYNHKVRQPLTLKTDKHLDKSLKIVMLTDLHLGYHNRRAEFHKWVDLINAEYPDLVLIGGDIVDISVHPLLEDNMAQEFHRLNAPVYACLGNHEYYSGDAKARQFFHDAGIILLRDSVAEVDGINIIGRDDRTNPYRKSVSDLVAKADKSKFTLMMDHQPYKLDDAEKAGVDFQLSGHTHYGQVWPISWIEDAMYEDAYGPLQKGKTQYYVTSGIGIWGGKFRIGTQSEYLVVNLIENKE